MISRVVFVDAVGGVLFVIEIADHGRVVQRGRQQVAELAQRVRADRVFLVIADHGAQIGFALVDAEVVHPEPCHLLLQLVGRVQVAQQRAGGGFFGQAVQLLLVGALRGFLASSSAIALS
jgi:hypothetical protein